MTLNIFPPMRWTRLGAPGRERARIERFPEGWRLDGHLLYEEEDGVTTVYYRVLCDPRWRTLAASVDGRVGERPVRLALSADGEGGWLRDGVPVAEIAGALDVDLDSTPATHTPTIRRLRLEVGETAHVRTAWFRFPQLSVEPLEQTYTRERAHYYRLDRTDGGHQLTTHLATDKAGWVVHAEGLWASTHEE